MKNLYLANEILELELFSKLFSLEFSNFLLEQLHSFQRLLSAAPATPNL